MARAERAAKLSDLDGILLCLIRAHEDISGYQLRNYMKVSIGYFYQAHLSQIYPSLGRLSDAGMVTYHEVVREGKPNLKLYRITDAGAQAAQEWLRDVPELTHSRSSADMYYLKFSLMGFLDSESLSDYIDAGLEALETQRGTLEQRDIDEAVSKLTVEDPDVCARYEMLWKRVNAAALNIIERRQTWLQELKESIV